MFQWCQDNVSGISFFYVSSEDINNHANQFQLDQRHFDKATSEISINDIKVGDYYACIYDNKWCICIATYISFKKQDVHFKVMKKSHHNTFSWPRRIFAGFL